MALTDDSHDTSLLMVIHRSRRFQAHDIVINLVTGNGIGRNIHEPDGLWHNQMGGDMLIHKNGAHGQFLGLCNSTTCIHR